MMCGWCFALLIASMPLFGVSDYRKFAVCLPFEIGDSVSLGECDTKICRKVGQWWDFEPTLCKQWIGDSVSLGECETKICRKVGQWWDFEPTLCKQWIGDSVSLGECETKICRMVGQWWDFEPTLCKQWTNFIYVYPLGNIAMVFVAIHVVGNHSMTFNDMPFLWCLIQRCTSMRNLLNCDVALRPL
jgi:hypothetical protein